MKKLAFLMLLLSSFTFAQEPKKEIYLTEIFERVTQSDEEYEITNQHITSSNISLHNYLIENVGRENLEFDEEGRIMVKADLKLFDCTIDILRLDSLHFSGLFFVRDSEFSQEITERDFGMRITKGNLDISNCVFDKFMWIWDNKIGNVNIDSSIFHHWTSFDNNQIINDLNIYKSTFFNELDLNNKSLRSIIIDQTTFKPLASWPDFHPNDEYYHQLIIGFKNYLEDFSRSYFDSNQPYSIQILNSTFEAGEFNQVVVINRSLNNLQINNNHFGSILSLRNSEVEKRFQFINNKLDSGIALNGFIYPEFSNQLRWDGFNGQKILVHRSTLNVQAGEDDINFDGTGIYYLFRPYKGLTKDELASETEWQLLVESYRKLYDIFKQNGDLKSANEAYSELKDIEGRRLKYIYELDGGFRNYFRWKLNRLLKIYTNHGTDPALAISISFYVILAFAIFYFFFPSEWDITSKSKLIKDFKDFTQKNDKGYIRPFLSMLLGFIISLINALTLSLNAFTTLGFGRIPTKGLAKYVCVMQGFIGWFLLSIFTVALINQVLA